MATTTKWNAVRSVTCGHLRAEHNYQRDPRQEWSDRDIALINAAPELAEACREVVRWYQEMSGNPNCPVPDKYWTPGALKARAALAAAGL